MAEIKITENDIKGFQTSMETEMQKDREQRAGAWDHGRTKERGLQGASRSMGGRIWVLPRGGPVRMRRAPRGP